MPIKFRCPKCSQAYSIASRKAGTSMRCQKCDAKMRIPAEAGNTEPQPESEPDLKPDSDENDDDLAAVLAFEQLLKEDEPAPTPMAPLPDELFSEDDEEDEDDSWGGGRGGDDAPSA